MSKWDLITDGSRAPRECRRESIHELTESDEELAAVLVLADEMNEAGHAADALGVKITGFRGWSGAFSVGR